MDEHGYTKLTDQDEKTSSNQDIQFPKGLRQKFMNPSNNASAKFINPRKEGLASKQKKESERMKKIASIYTDSFSNKKGGMSDSKKTFTEQVSKAYKEQREKKRDKNCELTISKKGLNLEDMYYQKSQVLVGQDLVEAFEIEELGGFKRYSQFKTSKKKEVDERKEEKKDERKDIKEEKKEMKKEIQKIQKMIDKKRKTELELAKEILSGKISIIWIFAISKQLPKYEKSRIIQMYSGLSEKESIVPLCKSPMQIKPFLEIPNSWFKIVSDLHNISEIIKFKTHKRVVQFYIYNNKKEEGISQSLKYKTEIKKVKGIYTNLDRIIDRAQDEIQNEVQLFQLQNGIAIHKNLRKFPSFLKLSGEDKTQATHYRSNLYGARNLPVEEKIQRFKDFIFLVIERYAHIEKEKQNIIDYRNLDHSKKIETLDQASKVLQFYVRESFYYQLLNTMLRTIKTTEEFRPCILPFSQTYHSIKLFYNTELEKNKRKIEPQTLYRGAILREKDFKKLKSNVFIQMFGFMSTSKNFHRAADFTEQLGYIFVIHVPEMKIPKRFQIYDHGFVDINEHNLAPKKFAVEEQVLFNALNIYRVRGIEKSPEGFHLVHLEYGVIFDLLSKQKGELTEDQRDVLLNYQYSVNMLSKIQDQGDVHLLFNEYEESKNYYEGKIMEDNKNQGKFYYKLANVQQQCGELDEADKNAQISLQLQLKDLDLNDREKCLKVFSIHSKNAQISLQKEDYLYADEALSEAIELLDDDSLFEKGKKYRQRGEIKFKKGEIIKAEKDFEKSEKILKEMFHRGEQKKKEIKKNYFFSYLTLLCSSQSREDMEAEREEQLNQIQTLEMEIANIKENINDELIRVNKSLTDVAEYAEDKQKYQICVKKARSFLLELQSRKTNDPHEKARLKVMEATVQDYLELAESQKLLNEAIKLIESSDPYNEEVGKYSTILAKLQKQDLEKFSNPKCLMKAKLQKGDKIEYNEEEHKKVYEKCKNNYEKAINILMYHNKTNAAPEVITLKNQLGELNYNESHLEDSYKLIKEVKDAANNNTDHSEVSKSCLLLSKIAFCRGQLKNSFQNVQEAKDILKKAIVKKNEEKYLNIYHESDTYLEIKLHRSKIYLRQLNHDLSLKDIQSVKQYLNIKLKQQEFHSFLADAYEIQAENLGANKQMYQFDSYFKKAIQLREKQIGIYNIANAVAYCNYAKFLIIYKDLQGATEALQKAVQIFSCFSHDHPITWLLLYSSSLLKSMKERNDQCLEDFESCLKLALKKYDKSHITIHKLRLQYGKELQKMGENEKAVRQFEALEDDLAENIRASHSRKPIYEETDDEKVTIQKLLYKSLQSSYQEKDKKEDSLKGSLANHYEDKFKNLTKTYNISKQSK